MTVRNLMDQVGFNKYVGIRLVEWSPEYACFELDLDTHHLNKLGVAHGGVLLSVLDAACGLSGCYCPPPQKRRLCMTMSLNTNFISPMQPGLLRAEARQIGGGKAVFFAEGKIIDDDGKLIATAAGTFRRLSGDRKG